MKPHGTTPIGLRYGERENVRREFLHVDDMARASLFVMCLPEAIYRSATKPMLSHLNAGTGVDLTIRELAELIADVVGFEGKIEFDTSKPDGAPRKLLDVERMRSLGWSPEIPLRDGISQTYEWYREHESVAG